MVKTNELEVMSMVLPAGKKILRHQAASAITGQCLEGAIEFESRGRTQVVLADTMLKLLDNPVHASVRLTIEHS